MLACFLILQARCLKTLHILSLQVHSNFNDLGLFSGKWFFSPFFVLFLYWSFSHKKNQNSHVIRIQWLVVHKYFHFTVPTGISECVLSCWSQSSYASIDVMKLLWRFTFEYFFAKLWLVLNTVYSYLHLVDIWLSFKMNSKLLGMVNGESCHFMTCVLNK